MAQLPPKIPQNWANNSFHPHNQQPYWVDEFLDFTAARRGAHRRSASSDSIAFLESTTTEEFNANSTRNSAALIMMQSSFDKLDDEQLMSMFSDEFSGAGAGAGDGVVSSNPSTSNSDDRDSNNNDEKLPQKLKSEPEEVEEEGCSEGDEHAPPLNSSSNAVSSGDTVFDPKRVKRILANRQSAQRSRVRKLQYISELERSVTTLQSEVSALSPRVAFLDHQRLILNVDNTALKQRIAALAQDNIFKDDSTVNACVMYNGVWELDGRDWIYKGSAALTIDIDPNLSYSGLVDVLYEELDVDKAEYDLKLEVNYKYRKGYEYPPEVIRNDKRARYFLSTLAKKPDEFIPLFVTLLKKNVCVDPSPTPSFVKDNRSEVGSFVGPETNPEVLVADVLPELNNMMPSADIVAQMPFIDGFFNGPDPECYVEGNDGVRDDQGAEAPAAVPLNLTPLSYQIPPRPPTRKRMPRRENCQTPGTSSSRPGETSHARGTTDSTGPDNGRETNDISGPTDARGTNVTGWSDPFSSSTSYGKFKEKMYTREDIEDHSHYISTGGTPGGELHVGKFFRDKEHLKMVVGLYAMKKGFDYYVRKSGTDIWYVTCKDTDCGWRLRAKKNVLSNMFEVSTFHNVHTCSLDLRGKDNRQASPVIVAHLIKDKFTTDGSDQLPSDIRKSMHKDYGIQMSYEKAWRCREKAIHLTRGTPEDSYSLLPSYLHMLQLRNPGTITDFVVEDGRFKYCFFSLGPSIRGFKFCRPVICVDGSFLKTRYGGQMLCAVALDAGSHIFPIAFAIVDSENHNSWTYFMRKLKETIGDVENLAFVSDRHQSIVRALDIVFPDAHHGACYHHIIMNVNHKFKTDVFTNHIYTCAYTYSRSEFHREFENIRAMNPAVAKYLEEIGFEKWVRSYFPGVRYNVMTSNWAESFNNTTKDARGFPITAAVAFLRSKVQKWFASRKEKADKWTKPLAPEMEEDLALHFEKGRFLNVDSCGPYTLQVHPGRTVLTGGVVDFQEKSCTCGLFQCMKFPCPHACAASQERSISVYTLCSPYYTTEYWRRTYEGTIMPVGDEDDWELPDDIKNMTVGVPVEKQPVGRPKKQKVGRIKNNRTACNGERIIKSRKCSKCGATGHNRSTCTYRGLT